MARENFTFDTDLDFLLIFLFLILFEMEVVLLLLKNQVLEVEPNKLSVPKETRCNVETILRCITA